MNLQKTLWNSFFAKIGIIRSSRYKLHETSHNFDLLDVSQKDCELRNFFEPTTVDELSKNMSTTIKKSCILNQNDTLLAWVCHNTVAGSFSHLRHGGSHDLTS